LNFEKESYHFFDISYLTGPEISSEEKLMKKYVLITGVSSGLGYDATRYLLGQGFSVIGSVRSLHEAERLKTNWGEEFHPVVFDVTDRISIAAAVPVVKERVGSHGLCGLVNNAGIAVSGPIKHVPIDRWEKQMQVNVLGLVRVTQAFLPLLGGDKDSPFKPGRIVNISSISGLIANPFMGPYCASKYAVEAINDIMRRELSMYGIKVVCIQPGVARSEIWDKAMDEPAEYGMTDYDHLLSKRKKIIEGLKARAIDPENVSRTIYKALTLPDPRLRYVVARKAWLIRLLAYYMPGKWLDRMFTRNMKKENVRAV